MRIVGGEYRGIRIPVPPNFRARPTTDMAKESLFNILSNKIDFSDVSVLDLFSGTGSIAFEFISRGSTDVVLVEKNYIHFKYILKCKEKLKIGEGLKPIKSDVFRYISSCKRCFNLIFADPPYDLENLEGIPGVIFSKDILAEKGFLILEHPGKYNFSSHENFTGLRKYGSVHFSFFEKK